MFDPRGILAQQDSSGDWAWMVNDGLGSVRSVLDEGFDPLYSTHYAPYGDPWGAQGTNPTNFGFTGEPTDANGLAYLRARYYDPALGVFPSLDPLEGGPSLAMSLNRYAYVGGNVVNRVDPSGLQACQDANSIRTLLNEGFAAINDPQTDPRFEQYGEESGCRGPYPFGCDASGNPIPYAIVQGFQQGPYDISLCSQWQGTRLDDSSDYHCGLDIVSYTDTGFLWKFGAGYPANEPRTGVYFATTSETYVYNWETGVLESDGSRQGTCLNMAEVSLGNVRFRYRGVQDVPANTTRGRKVFAVADGTVYTWASGDVTLKVNSGPISDNTILQIQYTHLRACSGQDPAHLTGTRIRQGQILGCYDEVGSTLQPHLHILYKQVASNGANLTTYERDHLLCDPASIYLNPLNPVPSEACEYCDPPIPNNSPHLWISSRWGRFPEYIRQYGYTPTRIDRPNDRWNEWVEQPRR